MKKNITNFSKSRHREIEIKLVIDFESDLEHATENYTGNIIQSLVYY